MNISLEKFKQNYTLIHIQSYTYTHILMRFTTKWVPISSTGKFSDGWIRDLGFNPYQQADAIEWNYLKKKKKKKVVLIFEKLHSLINYSSFPVVIQR